MSRTHTILFICFSVMVIVGDTLICLFFTDNTANDIIGIALALILSLCVALTVKWMKNKFADRVKGSKKIYAPLCIGGCLICTVFALFTVNSFSSYAASVMLSAKDVFLPFITLSALAIYIALSEKNVIIKLSLILFPLAALMVGVMFAFSVQFMNIKYIIPYKPPQGFGFIRVFLPLFASLSAASIPLALIGKKSTKGAYCLSFALAGGLIFIAVINVLGIFGGDFASNLSYPYSQAVSTASMGEIFSRLDGFLYATCFFTTIIKCSALTLSAVYFFKKALKTFDNKK